MRVGLFIDTDNYGGAEAIVMSLASHLTAARHQPIFYHFGNPYLERACAELEIECRLVSHRHYYKRTLLLPLFARHFARMLAADRLDVLHSHLFGPIVAGGLSCWLARVPHIGTLHDVYIVQERPIRARLLTLVHRLGTQLVCVAGPMAEYYASVARIPMADLRVIKNGVDLSRYATEREGGRDAGVIRLIMVGRLDAIKRHDLMLHALSGMASVPRWELSIVGDGPARESLEQLCRTLRLDARVKFLGQRSDVPALLADANIFALVSDSEGMSLSLIEAIASGLPVVATTVGNNSELVRNGWNGVLIPPGDGAALEKALRRLVENDELRSTFGANSRHISGNELDLRTALSSYVSLYEQTRQARGRKLGQNSV